MKHKRKVRVWADHNWRKEVFFTAAYVPYNAGPFLSIWGEDGSIVCHTAVGSKYDELINAALNFRDQYRQCINT